MGRVVLHEKREVSAIGHIHLLGWMWDGCGMDVGWRAEAETVDDNVLGVRFSDYNSLRG